MQPRPGMGRKRAIGVDRKDHERKKYRENKNKEKSGRSIEEGTVDGRACFSPL